LNFVRQNYGELAADPCEPLRNRALNKGYPPGSVIKPVILAAGIESGQITPSQVIGCPSQKAPQGWPSCWIFRNNHIGHDTMWTNNARNAIKGSCNIYFSHLADRIDEITLQSWLFRFGYGHRLPIEETNDDINDINNEQLNRHLRQAQGQISNELPKDTITSFEQLPPLEPSEKRWFGIGHGNFRATPLQVANEMTIIARGGIYKVPKLLNYEESPAAESNDIENTDEANELKKFEVKARPANATINLGINQVTMGVIWDGMHAVTSESSGTANREFSRSIPFFSTHGVKIYGKTGSTEQPEHAWFGGFAKDNNGKSVAVAIVVEGGQQGSADAAPLGRDILQFCVEEGYIGR
jgi:penicillin-binding protein 2